MCDACKIKVSRQEQGSGLYSKRRESQRYHPCQGGSAKAIVERRGTWLETNREKVNRLRNEAFLKLAEAITIRHSILRRPVVHPQLLATKRALETAGYIVGPIEIF